MSDCPASAVQFGFCLPDSPVLSVPRFSAAGKFPFVLPGLFFPEPPVSASDKFRTAWKIQCHSQFLLFQFLQSTPQEMFLDRIQTGPNSLHSDPAASGREFRSTDVFFDKPGDQKNPFSPAFHRKVSMVFQIKRTNDPAESLLLQNTVLPELLFFLPDPADPFRRPDMHGPR